MTETTDIPNALNSVKDLVTRLRAAETLVAALKLQIATVKDELSDAMRGGAKPTRKARAARVALGPGLKADGTARKVRGPNRPKPTFTDASAA